MSAFTNPRLGAHVADPRDARVGRQPLTLSLEASNLLLEKPSSPTYTSHATLSRTYRQLGTGVHSKNAALSPSHNVSAMLQGSVPAYGQPLANGPSRKSSTAMGQAQKTKERVEGQKLVVNARTKAVQAVTHAHPQESVAEEEIVEVAKKALGESAPSHEISKDKNKSSSERDPSPESSAPRKQ